MKTISHRKTFLKTILILALLSGFKAAAQSLITFSKPGNSQEYDHNGTGWDHISNTSYTYNLNGKLTSQVITDPITNQNRNKIEFSYDIRGNEKSYFSYRWQNNTWTLTNWQKDSLIYDSNNRLTFHITTWMQTSSWAGQSLANTYDAAGNLIVQLVSDLDNGNWVPSRKLTYTYVNGIRTEELTEQLTGGNWQYISKDVYAVWHVPNVQPSSYIRHTFNSFSNQWSPSSRYTISMTLNGGSITLIDRFQNNNWVNDRRITENKDFRGNYSGNLNERFVNGTWVPFAENQTIFTYNSLFDITEEVFRYPNIVGNQFIWPVVDQNKIVYSNFQYFTKVLGNSEDQQITLALNVYPNPATDNITIQLADEKPQAITVTVKDITGKSLLTKTFKVEEVKQLNIEALPKGIYLLQLQTETRSTIKRIVKQ